MATFNFKTTEISEVFTQLLNHGLDMTTAMAFGRLIAECEDDGSGLLEFFHAVLEQYQNQNKNQSITGSGG